MGLGTILAGTGVTLSANPESSCYDQVNNSIRHKRIVQAVQTLLSISFLQVKQITKLTHLATWNPALTQGLSFFIFHFHV